MRARRSAWLAAFVAVVLCAGIAVAVVRATSGTPDRAGVASYLPGGIGMIGPYSATELGPMRDAGITQTLVELSWAAAEPSPGQFNQTYLQSIRGEIQRQRDAGFSVALNPGLSEAPGWLLAKPGARYVDQTGQVYTEEPLPNLVFGLSLRPFAQDYLDEIARTLGTQFSIVRVGGGHFGELGYPFLIGADHRVENRYWAFDPAAARADPVPGWRPGDPSPAGQAGRFLTWYLQRLVGYQNWQLSALRTAGFSGWLAVLYPSSGFDRGAVKAAIADNLDGSSLDERRGEIQRGYDWARQIGGLSDPKTVVYGTWGDHPNALHRLARLAQHAARPLMAENSGANTTAALVATLADAHRVGVQRFYLVRAATLIDPSATPDQLTVLSRRIR